MKYLTSGQIAEVWNISSQTVRNYCKEGRIPGAKYADGQWKVPANAEKPRKKSIATSEEAASPKELPKLASKIFHQMSKKNYHGLYDYVQINLAYSSCRMASVRLTRNQTTDIFLKGKVKVGFEPMKISDLIETWNHFVAMKYVISNLMEPLSPAYIQRVHRLLSSGTVDATRGRVRPGEYRTARTKAWTGDVKSSESISRDLKSLISNYESLKEVSRREILEFHVHFERLSPFDDYNGRVGRIIMFKECLRHDVLPFILDDKKRKEYLEGIREWEQDCSILSGAVLDAQTRFERQIELHRLKAHGRNFLPEEYEESLEEGYENGF